MLAVCDSGKNPGDFYSGHYMTCGINVQAGYDVDSRFILFGVIAPGKCSNQVAFERTSLPNRISSFDTAFYLVGNVANTLSEILLVPGEWLLNWLAHLMRCSITVFFTCISFK